MIAGITGHQNIGDKSTIEWVRYAIREQVIQRGVSRGLTSLAAGADQLFAVVLASLKIHYGVVVPCMGYEGTFVDASVRRSYEKLLANSDDVHRLEFPAPSEQAFYGAGRWIVQSSELLVAVWNGRPARGLGGTGDVVAFAKSERRRCVHINPITRVVEEI